MNTGDLNEAERELIAMLRDRSGDDFAIGIGRGLATDGTHTFNVTVVRPLDPAPVKPDIGLGGSFEDAWLARSGRSET